ncbi:MAG: symmetrical bis(5'-nucleosyl)-tetraphosphatase [Gammaproteobacteria bacterium]|nr:symmetrical bis(5'-nucleosyl)-tetraphosphatase [Gammaproteobacteria bacterium]
MAVYAIGDIQGCFSELEQLLNKINFDINADKLWFVGDLVNRGPQSLETIQFVRSIDDSVQCVLGNHDIHLIACYVGVQTCKPKSSLNQILQHSQAREIIDWLRFQPLLHYDPALKWLMVHAGLIPQWDLALAQKCANEIETQLRSNNYIEFLSEVYGNTPNQWNNELTQKDRWRVTLNALTRLRLCDQHGRMDFDYKGPLGEQNSNLHAWFDIPRKSEDLNIIFGHWSALGLKHTNNLLGLDTGCLWGSQLTAAQIDTSPVRLHQIDCEAKKKITSGE